MRFEIYQLRKLLDAAEKESATAIDFHNAAGSDLFRMQLWSGAYRPTGSNWEDRGNLGIQYLGRFKQDTGLWAIEREAKEKRKLEL